MIKWKSGTTPLKNDAWEAFRSICQFLTSREIFETSKIEFKIALKINEYKDRLVYENSSVNANDKNEKKRKHNVIWYNPPYSANVKTNIRKIFFKILNKHFPRGHTVKLNDSSTKNMASLIATHNLSILNPNDQVYGCNCPLQHKCSTPGIVHQATVTNNKDDVEKIYYGLCETALKGRYRNLTSFFRHEKNRNETELSNYIWALKKT